MRIGRSKIITGVIIVATVALAGIASYSAFKLFGPTKVAVTPTAPSPSYAFSCQDYQLLVNTDGIVRIKNGGTETQPTRDIDLLINGEVIGNFSVPALTAEEDAILGNINLPTGDFNWSIGGDVNCQEEEGRTHEFQTCDKVSFAVSGGGTQNPTATPTGSVVPTATVTSTPIPTNTPTDVPTSTPTSRPVGGTDPTSTPRPTTSSVAPTTATTQAPTKTAVVTQAPSVEELPEAGISYPTILILLLGILLLTGGLIFAL